MADNNNDQGPDDIEKALAEVRDDQITIVKNDVGVVADLNRSDLECQLDAAHRWPRSTKAFLREAMGLATLTKAVAESCIYTVPRAGTRISGPSVRLAEIEASAYGNLHIGARPLDVGREDVTSQGVAWDLQKNLRVTIEAKRRITSSSGKRYGEDMILMTQNAATSIALRNAIFRVIPRAYTDMIYAHVRKVAVGDAKTLSVRRQEILDGLGRLGVDVERVLAVVGKAAIDDVDLADVEHLVGLGTAIHNGDATAEEAFPAPSADMPQASPENEGKRMPLGKKRGSEKTE